MSGTLKEFEAKEKEVVENQDKTKTQDNQTTETKEIPKTDEGKETVKESVVIIDGKERPLKNYEAEMRRKHEEEMDALRRELDVRNVQIQSQSTQTTQQQWLDQVYTMAENEIATTGKAVPIQTILQLANSLSQRNLETNFKTREQSEKAVRSFKRSIKNEPDFTVLEDDFDSLVDQLKPEQINTPTLEVILNSVRGKKLPELLKKAKEDAKKEAEKDTTILGQPTTTTTGGGRTATTITPEQKIELDRMNNNSTIQWSEDEYLTSLRKKQERFKGSGAKNIPQLLNDQMIK